MMFNSYSFWLFYVIVFALYRFLPRRGQNLLLLVASYYFYGCWDVRFLSLIAISTAIDYGLGLALGRTENDRWRRVWLATSLACNLGLLGFFKYYGFFANELAALCHAIGAPTLLPTWHILLPVGISFYTFQTMSYTIDVYRRQLPPARDPLDFAVFVAFFPQLVAGPIERASRFLPQVQQARVVTGEDFRVGLYFVVLGLFRKIVIADNMAPLANAVFSQPASNQSGLEILLGVVAFAFQIYGDFSGYSSIARGVARWLGFDLMTNFRQPYFAVSPSDFWRRWHISLSEWLRDYLYIPLGGNRGSNWATQRNLLATMLLGGLWHGAAWTFVAWGAFHGAVLCAYRGIERRKSSAAAGPFGRGARRVMSTSVMFAILCVSWLLFRAESLGQAGEMLSRIMSDPHVTPFAITMAGLIAFYVTPLLIFEAWLESGQEELLPLRSHWMGRGLLYSYAVWMMLFFPPPTPGEFIYFQF